MCLDTYASTVNLKTNEWFVFSDLGNPTPKRIFTKFFYYLVFYVKKSMLGRLKVNETPKWAAIYPGLSSLPNGWEFGGHRSSYGSTSPGNGIPDGGKYMGGELCVNLLINDRFPTSNSLRFQLFRACTENGNASAVARTQSGATREKSIERQR